MASVVAFVILAVTATTMVTQTTYARTYTMCVPGYHSVTPKQGGEIICVPDTNTTK